MRSLVELTFVLLFSYISILEAQFQYPEVPRDPSILDNYHGTQVADPYRYLENSSSIEVQEFIDKQNALTSNYLEASPSRDLIRERLSDLWNYTKYDVPQKQGNRYFFYAQSGLDNHPILYVQTDLASEPQVFLDPNALSQNGTIAISDPQAFSIDGEIFAYSLSESGSSWVTIRFKNVTSGEEFPETLTKVKQTDIAWTYDNLGIFYGAFPDWNGDPTNEDRVENMKIFYHRVGTNQSEDILVVEFPDNPQWLIGRFIVSNHGKSILVGPEDGLGSFTSIYYFQIPANITEKFDIVPIVTDSVARFKYIGNDASFYYILTNKNAPNYRMVVIDALNSNESAWTELVPEHPENTLLWVVPIDADKMVLSYIDNVKTRLELRDIYTGKIIKKLELETGKVVLPPVKRADTELFLKFESFLIPNRIYLLNFTKLEYELEVYRDVQLADFDPLDFEVEQIFYPSKDNTSIPMYIVHKKNVTLNGQAPGMLYGYGGLSVSILPEFSVARILFLQNFDGIYAIANIRGGGEYGEDWHNGGRLENKQNSFDDFQSAAEYLIANNYTHKLTIQGQSNGGLLIGACVNQRPELFSAAIPQVGVMDMLRYHKFSTGYAWISEYGSSDDAEQFEYIYKYSPLHNIQIPANINVQYPAVLVMARKDDQYVVPSHSFKYSAELQFEIGGNARQTNPLLLRVDSGTGHSGEGQPISKLIEEQVDIYSFLIQSIGLSYKP